MTDSFLIDSQFQFSTYIDIFNVVVDIFNAFILSIKSYLPIVYGLAFTILIFLFLRFFSQFFYIHHRFLVLFAL